MNSDSEKCEKELLKKLMHGAAQALLQRLVLIRFRKTRQKRGYGETYRNTRGEYIIVLDPELSIAELYVGFIHELAHDLLKHPDQTPPIDEEHIPIELAQLWESGGLSGEMSPAEIVEYQNSPIEQAANSVALSIDEAAIHGAWARFGNAGFMSRMKYLATVEFSEEEQS